MAALTPVAPCPICGERASTLAARRFPRFVVCSACGGYFLMTPPSLPGYQSEYFQEESAPSVASTLAKPLLDAFLHRRVRRVRSLLGGNVLGRVLDYGAGSGKLVSALRRRGIDAVGYDSSPGAAALAGRAGIPVEGVLPPGPFDLIMFWHSLEHVDDPLVVIRRVRPLLNPGGRLVVAVPNAASWEAAIAGERWFHYDYPFHRVHFTPQAITVLMARAGFRVTSTDFFNPEYTVSGLLQTFLNVFLLKDALYHMVSHRRGTMSRHTAAAAVGASAFLALVFSPLLAAFFLAELMSRRTDAMVVIASYEDEHPLSDMSA